MTYYYQSSRYWRASKRGVPINGDLHYDHKLFKPISFEEEEGDKLIDITPTEINFKGKLAKYFNQNPIFFNIKRSILTCILDRIKAKKKDRELMELLYKLTLYRNKERQRDIMMEIIQHYGRSII